MALAPLKRVSFCSPRSTASFRFFPPRGTTRFWGVVEWVPQSDQDFFLPGDGRGSRAGFSPAAESPLRVWGIPPPFFPSVERKLSFRGRREAAAPCSFFPRTASFFSLTGARARTFGSFESVLFFFFGGYLQFAS